MMKALFVESAHGKSIFGRKDPGAVCPWNKSLTERVISVQVCNKLLKLLRNDAAFHGVLIQEVGVNTEASPIKKMSYVNSVLKMNNLDPKYCYGLALHMNASGDQKPHGFEIWHQKSNVSQNFAVVMTDALLKANVVESRPRPVMSSKDGKYGRFYIDGVPAKYLIVEMGFISNPNDVGRIMGGMDAIAEALFLKLKEIALMA